MRHSWTRYLPEGLRHSLAGQGELRKVAGNAAWQFADQLARMAIGLAVGIWLARYLGPEQYGLLSYALAFVALFGAFAAMGLDDIIVRDIVREPAGRDRILGSACLLRLCGGALAFAAAVGTIMLLRPGDPLSHALVALVACGSVFQAFSVIEFWFHAQVQARSVVLAKCCAFLLCSLAKVVLILAAAPLVAFAWVALAEVVLGVIGLAMAYQLTGHRLRAWRGTLATAGALFRDGWPLMLSGMVIMVYLRIDQVMLGELAGDGEVGVYSVAVRLAEVWYFIPTALYWTLFPGIVAARSESEELFYERLQKFYNLVVLAGYTVAIPVTLLSHWLVPLLFGAEYARGGPMLAVLIWANLFTGLEMARSGFLTAMNWTRLYLATVTLGCLLNIALNFWLIPLYGGMGAVAASLAAYWLAAHGACFLFAPLRRTGAMLTRALLWPRVW